MSKFTFFKNSYSETYANGWIVAIAAFFIGIVMSGTVIWHFEEMRVDHLRNVVSNITKENANRLQSNINQKLALLYPLAAMIEHDGTIHDFDSIGKRLVIVFPNISEIALAPDGIISQVVPITGNEKALGLNLLTDSDQKAEAWLTRNNKRLTLAGPLNLVQGGVGLVGRLPIFREEKFWGFVLIVIRFPDIINTTLLSSITQMGYQYTLSRINPNTKKEQVIASSGKSILDDPIEQIIDVPNAQWRLRTAPTHGWHYQWFLLIEIGLGVLISILLGYIAKQYAQLKNYRNYLEVLVQKRTAEIAETRNFLHTLLDTIPDMIWLKNSDGVYLLCNPIFERFFGAKEEVIVGKTDYDFLEKELADSFREKDRFAIEIKGKSINEEWVKFADDGSSVLLEITKVPMLDESGSLIGVLGIAHDITARKSNEAHIQNLAHFDQLTGLPNRILLNDRVTYLLNMAQRKNESLAVMFLDLDHFKNINDTLGHSIGDQVLIEVANRIKEALRDQDSVARLGGDEFIMLFPNTDSNAAMYIATKLIEVISKASMIENNELTITPSIGIAIYPNDGEDFETLLKNADTAMYGVKSASRNSFHFFTQEMQLNLARNLQLDNALRHALKRNELEVYYQPQISLSDGHIIGAEALVRWHHPKLGMISPAEFIPIAESSGQIIEIGEWVLQTAIQQTKEWIDGGFAPMIIAVNLSAIQFRQKNLLTRITDILKEVELPHQYLELELTEAVTMHNPESVINIMNKLYEQGIRMSIDDFGTGYSSLSYLKKFKVYKLKIDQSFIRDIGKDNDDRAIVSAIIDMAHNLGLKTIAEGVETAEQLDFLHLHGCDEVQGYYFSKPLPCAEFEIFFKNFLGLPDNI
ncbi:MAG: EAL domain-containing protein [Epsilonproteobacteria bacterium]|nr:EAL domain-containing protein [Campylobacterota bacterium]